MIIGQTDNMKIQVVFVILILLLPGCLEEENNVIEDQEIIVNWAHNGSRSNITLNIFHGENLDNATTNFTIKIMLNHAAAPYHADNMYKHVNAGNYNMTQFHRIIDNFMAQGGDFENHDGTGGYAADWYGFCNGDNNVNLSDCPQQESWNVPDEADNGLQHFPCTVSMAKTSFPNSGGSQFFLMPDDITHHDWLDGVHTVFGEITEGCEHVTTISEVVTGSADRPIVPVMIYNATIND